MKLELQFASGSRPHKEINRDPDQFGRACIVGAKRDGSAASPLESFPVVGEKCHFGLGLINRVGTKGSGVFHSLRKVWDVMTAAGGAFPVVLLMSVLSGAWISHLEFVTWPVIREVEAEVGSADGKHRRYDFDSGSFCYRQTNVTTRADDVVDSRQVAE